MVLYTNDHISAAFFLRVHSPVGVGIVAGHLTVAVITLFSGGVAVIAVTVISVVSVMVIMRIVIILVVIVGVMVVIDVNCLYVALVGGRDVVAGLEADRRRH